MIKQIKTSVSSLKKVDRKGFSLVELIVVMGIVAALAGSSAPLLIRYIDKARKAMDVQTASVIFRGAELGYTSGSDDAYGQSVQPFHQSAGAGLLLYCGGDRPES